MRRLIKLKFFIELNFYESEGNEYLSGLFTIDEDFLSEISRLESIISELKIFAWRR